MRVAGIDHVVLRVRDLERMIAAIRSVGLDSVELWDGHLHPGKASEDEFHGVRSRLNAAGIRVSAYCVNFPKDASDELLERGFRGALLLGTDLMTSSVQKPIVPRLDAWCVKHKVRLGLHNHWYAPSFKGDRRQEFERPEDFEEALQGRSEYLSINLDIGHFAAAGHDPVAFYRKHQQRIVSLHVKDRDAGPERSYRRFGQGATPIREVARALRETRFRYAANLEFEIEADDPTDGVRHAFEYFKAALLA